MLLKCLWVIALALPLLWVASIGILIDFVAWIFTVIKEYLDER